MAEGTGKGQIAGRVIRWTARCWSVASLGVVLLFLAGEPFSPSPGEWPLLLFFPVGVCGGMVVAWWREGLGGGITTGSLLTFYALHLATAGKFPSGWAWFVLAAPGILFLLSWRLSRTAGRERASNNPLPDSR